MTLDARRNNPLARSMQSPRPVGRVAPEVPGARDGQQPSHPCRGAGFDRVVDDVFEIQGDIAARVAQALGSEFLGDG